MKYICFDVSYFSHRGFHATGNMEYNGESTGAISSVLTAIFYHCKMFGISSPLFAFDSGKSYRKQIYPGYKDRPPKDKKEADDRREVFRQIKTLRRLVLPTIGFKNIYQQTGLEADDIMARVVRDNPNQVILATADEDLLQVVDECVWYSPATKKSMNEKTFVKKYGIPPRSWRYVKQIAGCNSDKVKGVHMVGEATAIKYLTGRLDRTSIAYQIIEASRRELKKRNGILVNLPHPLTVPVEIVSDEFSREGFLAICDLFGLEGLARRVDEWELVFK